MSVNYNASAVNRGLLLSCDFANPQNYLIAENLLSYSEAFNNNYWTAGSFINILSSNELDPIGTNTATLIQSRGQSYGGLNRFNGPAYGQYTTYTLSVYAKAGTWNYLGLRASGDAVSSAGENYTYFNLSTGISTSLSNPRDGTTLSSGMTYISNGWYRCYVTFTTGAMATGNVTDIAIVSATGSSTGVNANTFSGNETIYIWGAMLERNSSIGQYIKTSGTSLIASSITDKISGLNGALNNIQYYRYDSITKSINFDRSSSTVTGGFAQFTGTGNLTANNFLYNDHTMEIFARINDFNGTDLPTYQHANSLFNYQGYHSGFLYEYTGGNNLIYHGLFQGQGWYITYLPNNAVTANQWFHLVATRSGNVTTLYLNGVSVATQTYSTLYNPGTSDYIKIGAGNPAGIDFAYFTKMNCSIARMYNVALTADEVKQNFNAYRGRGGI